jgi:predicted DNA-binding protein
LIGVFSQLGEGAPFHFRNSNSFTIQDREQINDGIILSTEIYTKEGITVKKATFTKTVTVSVRPEVYERIKALTDEREISIADWVRIAIDKALENEASIDELRFLAGQKADLSTENHNQRRNP